MAGIALSGFNNLFNSGQILQALMASYSLPLKQLQQQDQYVQNQGQEVMYVYNQSMSLFTTLLGFNLNPITGSMTAFSSNPSILAANAFPNAPAGTYNISVSQIAQPEIALVGSFGSATAPISSNGSFTFYFRTNTSSSGISDSNLTPNTPGVQTFTINYSSNMSLTDIVNEINQTAGSDVTASLFYNGQNYSIMLAEKKGASTFTTSSTAHVIAISDTSGLFTPNYAQYAQNAIFSLGGVSITSPTNQINNIIPGVSLYLSSTGNTILSVSQDTSGVANNISALISQINNIITPINVLTEKPGTYSSQSSLTASNTFIVPGDFMGNGIITAVKSQLLSSLYPLEQLGVVSYNYKTGQVEFNSQSFTQLLSSSPSYVLPSITSFVQSLSKSVLNIVSGNGGLTMLENNYINQDAYLQQQMIYQQQYLAQEQRLLQIQFGQVEAYVTTMQQLSQSIQTLLG